MQVNQPKLSHKSASAKKKTKNKQKQKQGGAVIFLVYITGSISLK